MSSALPTSDLEVDHSYLWIEGRHPWQCDQPRGSPERVWVVRQKFNPMSFVRPSCFLTECLSTELTAPMSASGTPSQPYWYGQIRSRPTSRPHLTVNSVPPASDISSMTTMKKRRSRSNKRLLCSCPSVRWEQHRSMQRSPRVAGLQGQLDVDRQTFFSLLFLVMVNSNCFRPIPGRTVDLCRWACGNDRGDSTFTECCRCGPMCHLTDSTTINSCISRKRVHSLWPPRSEDGRSLVSLSAPVRSTH